MVMTCLAFLRKAHHCASTKPEPKGPSFRCTSPRQTDNTNINTSMAIAVASPDPSPTMPNFIAGYFSSPVPRYYSTKENFWTYISLSQISLAHLDQNLDIIFSSAALLKQELYSQRMRAAALFLKDYVLPSAPAMAEDGIPIPPKDMLEDIQSVAAKYGHEFALPVKYRAYPAQPISLSSCLAPRQRTSSEITLSSSLDTLASSSLECDSFELSRSYQAVFGERDPEDIPIRWALGSFACGGDDAEDEGGDGENGEDDVDVMRGATWDWRRHGIWGEDDEAKVGREVKGVVSSEVCTVSANGVSGMSGNGKVVHFLDVVGEDSGKCADRGGIGEENGESEK
ncbi:hypothetical protein B0J14DRAFT_684480 [Halenospora varia]|nr:hypothetical protein B0J14DRAFT_684480 [Halenospora varia]